MKKAFSMFFLLSLNTSLHLFAQADFNGRVVDYVSKEPVEGAVIEIKEGSRNVLTDQSGNFTFRANGDTAILHVTIVGYVAGEFVITKNVPLLILLERGSLNLKEIALISSGGTNSFFKTTGKIDLNLRPVKNSQELLQLVPGLFVAQHAGGGKAEQIFLRGFDADHGTDVQITVDGLPVNMVSHAHGQGYADAHFIIPETVNNVDFGTGPYYPSQGNFNTAGYINYSTFKSIDRSRVQLEAGRFNTFRTLAMIDLLKTDKTKQSAYLAGEFNYTDGPTINQQNLNRINIFGKYNLAISDNTSFILAASAFKSKWDASGQIPTRAVESGMIDRFGSVDPTEGGNTERYNVNLVINHDFGNGWNWVSQAYYSRYKFNLYSNFTFFLNDPVNGDEIQQTEARDIVGFLSKLTSRKNYYDWSITGTYAAGLRYDATQNTTLAHVVQREFLENNVKGNIKEANAFVFAEKQFTHYKWNIAAGIRADYFNNSYFNQLSTVQLPSRNKAIISPKLNIQYTINKTAQVYVKAGKGFHSNDTRVVVENNGYQILPAAYGTDAGFILKPTKKLLLNVAAWYLYLQQEFVYVGDEGVIEPSGKTVRVGIDLIGRYQFNQNLFANINVNLSKARSIEEPKGENYIPLAPSATSVGGLYYKVTKGFNGGLSYRYINNRPANETNTVLAKGYFLLDATVSYSMPKYEIGFAIENVLNKQWNEAQFNTESRLRDEVMPVTELHFTPGLPFFVKCKVALFF